MSLKSLLRKWLLRSEEKPQAKSDKKEIPTLRIAWKGNIVTVPVLGVSGLCLIVAIEEGQYMVFSGAAIDPEEFWKIWESLAPGKLTDEEGNPIRP